MPAVCAKHVDWLLSRAMTYIVTGFLQGWNDYSSQLQLLASLTAHVPLALSLRAHFGFRRPCRRQFKSPARPLGLLSVAV